MCKNQEVLVLEQISTGYIKRKTINKSIQTKYVNKCNDMYVTIYDYTNHHRRKRHCDKHLIQKQDDIEFQFKSLS